MGIVTLIAFMALLIFVYLKMPMLKGKHSERLVGLRLSRLPDNYTVLNNILLSGNSRSTQIDHVVVSPYGVFVIETKGYKGWIFGGEHSEYWTQVFYKSKRRFYNPIKQNEAHVKALRHLLTNSFEPPLIPIVVFNNDASLKINVKDHIVINRYYLVQTILCYKQHVLNDEQVQWIVKTIQENEATNSRANTKRHRAYARSRKHKAEQAISCGICPECGGQLVLRRGKYGSFYGCSNYPQCKFHINSPDIY